MGSLKRRMHVLNRKQRTEIPSNVIVVDTEADPLPMSDGEMTFVLRLGWAVHWRYEPGGKVTREQWFEFRTGEEFWQWAESLVKAKGYVLIIGHNVDYDIAVTGGYRWLYTHGYSLVEGWEESARYWHVYRGPAGIIRIMDSLNLFPMPLKVLGDSLGLEKLEVEFGSVSDEKLSAYCKRDVEIVMMAVRWLWETLISEDLGTWAETLAKQAMHCWLHKFLRHKVLIHGRDDVSQLERRSYRGGRIECYRLGEYANGPYYLVDVNSMYPYVMREHEYPCELLEWGIRMPMDRLRQMIDYYDIIADVEVEVDEPVYPYVIDGWVCYPTGYMRTTLTAPELRYALGRGWLQRISSYAIYRRAPIFKEYIEYFWNKRREAKQANDTAKVLIYKLLMNSLYGKLGQYVESWRKVGECDYDVTGVEMVVDMSTGARGWLRYREGIIEEHIGTYEGYDSMAAIPATVTAYARLYLWEMITRAGREHVYYVDTDSMIVDAEGLERLEELLNPTELGKLKLEKSTDKIVIRGPKDYVFGTEEKIKGIRKSAKQIEDNVYEQERWHGYKTRLREGQLDTFIVSRSTKTLERVYKKGIVGSDGAVTPYHLRREEAGS